MITISSNFDSGNIETISTETANNIQVKVTPDTNSDYLQWFHFRMQGALRVDCKINIINAGKTTYPFWENYNVRASYDRETWFAVTTHYDGEKLTIEHTPEYNSVFYAYFAPYSYEQHLDLVQTAQLSPECEYESLGKTVDGRDIDLLIAGQPSKTKHKIWIIARQHPGESMAEWFMQGLIYKLLDTDDPVSRKLLNNNVFYIIPNMNVDGSINGNLRANSAGANLNREWKDPTIEKSPEVFYVRNKMDQTGVSLCLDIHGDEEIPYIFTSGSEGIPNYSSKIKNINDKFIANWLQICPDFQNKKGYDIDKPGEADLSICSNQISQRYDCLALTIEMPFKDNDNLPDNEYNWSSERSEKLGESVLTAILTIIDIL